MTALSLSELVRERPIARRRALIAATDETREDIASAGPAPRQEPRSAGSFRLDKCRNDPAR